MKYTNAALFRELRVRGEWFRLDERLSDFIARHARTVDEAAREFEREHGRAARRP